MAAKAIDKPFPLRYTECTLMLSSADENAERRKGGGKMKLSIFTQHIWDMARSRGWTKDQAMDHVTGLGISGVEITYTEFQQTPKEDYKAMLSGMV